AGLTAGFFVSAGATPRHAAPYSPVRFNTHDTRGVYPLSVRSVYCAHNQLSAFLFIGRRLRARDQCFCSLQADAWGMRVSGWPDQALRAKVVKRAEGPNFLSHDIILTIP